MLVDLELLLAEKVAENPLVIVAVTLYTGHRWHCWHGAHLAH